MVQYRDDGRRLWEMRPVGAEVVVCTAGEITLVQELDGREVRTTLRPGEYAITRRASGTRQTCSVLLRPCSSRPG